jgi:hypothetical protein
MACFVVGAGASSALPRVGTADALKLGDRLIEAGLAMQNLSDDFPALLARAFQELKKAAKADDEESADENPIVQPSP